MANEEREAVLGPFSGGMNTYSQVGAIGDDELVLSMNLVSDIDGSLKCRPPMVQIFEGNAFFNFLCVRAVGSGIITGANYVFFSNHGAVYSWDGTNMNKISTTTTTGSICSFQYKGTMYFPGEDDSYAICGTWAGGAWGSVAAMPSASAALMFKERAWVSHYTTTPPLNNSRLYFSAIGDPTTWNPADFFDIAPGDGSDIIDIKIFNNNLLIFKQNSTYYLSYDSKPADATIVKISNTIGASMWSCVAEYQNNIFVMHQDTVYQLVNFNWVPLNTKVPFILDATHPSWSTRNQFTHLSTVGDWLLCKFHNKMYVYNLISQTWGQFSAVEEKLNDVGPFVRFPSIGTFNVNNNWVAGNSLTNATTATRMKNGWEAGVVEFANATNLLINCSIVTKTYTFNLPWKFKRLWSWAVECVTNRAITGTAIPLSITNPTSVPTTVAANAAPLLRRMYRFPKGLRFREIQFTVDMTSDGSPADGPAQIYIILALVKGTEMTPKAVN